MMVEMFLMFISWGLYQKAIMPLWVCIVLTVFTAINFTARMFKAINDQ